MFFPFGTDRPLARPTLITFILVAVNIGVFIALAAVGRTDPSEAERFGEILALDPRDPHPWAFLSYAFVHADWLHLAGNMLFLWVFGPNVEDRFGRAGFLIFYAAAGAGAGALHGAFEEAPVIGASGAIAGVTGAYLVLFPRTAVRTLVFFFYIGIVWIPAAWFIGARILWDVMLQGSGRHGDTATLAHLGGYALGISVSMLLLWTRLLAREPFDLFTISRQAARRRQFREAAHKQRIAQSRPRAAAPEEVDAVAAARAEVSHGMSSLDMPAAAEAYRRLLAAHGASPSAGILSRRHQYDLANHLFSSGDYATAAEAYERFLKGYPQDPEAPHIRLLLGRINARYLNDPIEAKRLLAEAVGQLRDEESLALARQELADLG